MSWLEAPRENPLENWIRQKKTDKQLSKICIRYRIFDLTDRLINTTGSFQRIRQGHNRYKFQQDKTIYLLSK